MRKVLGFTEKSVNILVEQEVNGAALLLYEDRIDLKTSLGLPEGSARTLWAEIETMKKAQADSGTIQYINH